MSGFGLITQIALWDSHRLVSYRVMPGGWGHREEDGSWGAHYMYLSETTFGKFIFIPFTSWWT